MSLLKLRSYLQSGKMKLEVSFGVSVMETAYFLQKNQ